MHSASIIPKDDVEIVRFILQHHNSFQMFASRFSNFPVTICIRVMCLIYVFLPINISSFAALYPGTDKTHQSQMHHCATRTCRHVLSSSTTSIYTIDLRIAQQHCDFEIFLSTTINSSTCASAGQCVNNYRASRWPRVICVNARRSGRELSCLSNGFGSISFKTLPTYEYIQFFCPLIAFRRRRFIHNKCIH